MGRSAGSIQRTAILAAVSTHNAFGNNSYYHSGNHGNTSGMRQGGGNGANLHGNVNILLGGAMLAVVATVVFIVCYCCHRNIKRRSESVYRQHWFDADPNMEIYSVEQCFDTSSLYREQSDSGVSITSNAQQNNQHGPPPAYDIVVALDELQRRGTIKKCLHANCPLSNYSSNMRYDEIDEASKNYVTVEDMEATPSGAEITTENKDNDDCDPNNKNENNNNNNNNNVNNYNNHSSNSSSSLCTANLSNHNLCDCNATMIVAMIPPLNARLCKNCGELIDGDDANCNQVGGNKCFYNYITSVANPNGQIIEEGGDTLDQILHDVRNNNNTITRQNTDVDEQSTTVTESLLNTDDVNDHNTNNNNNNNNNISVDLQPFNGNGLIRLDMSQIIDNTGLPTYEAALKLEASGYV